MRRVDVVCVLGPILLLASSPSRADDLPTIIGGCTPCHGEDGFARSSDVPHLAGQNDVYLVNQLQAFRSGERAHPEMAYMTLELDDEDIAALAAYFSELPVRP